MERLMSPSNYPPSVGKFRPEQVAHRSTWHYIPDDQVRAAAMHIIHSVPANGSTITEMNPLDPGTVSGANRGDGPRGWLADSIGIGPTIPAGRV